jgi:hypothetical protein
MLQYLPAFKLPHGNAAFGERRLPEIAPLGRKSTTFQPTKNREKFLLDSLSNVPHESIFLVRERLQIIVDPTKFRYSIF